MSSKASADDSMTPRTFFGFLYTATSPAGALTEVLADLRPHYDRISEIALITDEADDDDDDAAYEALISNANAAMKERLAGRCMSAIEIADRGTLFVDLGAGATRSRIELQLDFGRLKVGDFIGRDRTVSRYASRAVFEDQHAGLIAPSAEDSRARTVAIFETAHESNAFRVRLNVISTVPADVDRSAVTLVIGTLLRAEEYSPLICPELVRPESEIALTA